VINQLQSVTITFYVWSWITSNSQGGTCHRIQNPRHRYGKWQFGNKSSIFLALCTSVKALHFLCSHQIRGHYRSVVFVSSRAAF